MKYVVESINEDCVYPVLRMYDKMGRDTDHKEDARSIVVDHDGEHATVVIQDNDCILTIH